MSANVSYFNELGGFPCGVVSGVSKLIGGMLAEKTNDWPLVFHLASGKLR